MNSCVHDQGFIYIYIYMKMNIYNTTIHFFYYHLNVSGSHCQIYM